MKKEVKITQVHKRYVEKTKNHFDRFTIEYGDVEYIVFSENQEITNIKSRTWDKDRDDCASFVDIEKLPAKIFKELNTKHYLIYKSPSNPH